LVVLRVEQQARVVDLEDVDVGEVPMKRLRLRDRVHAVERMGEVDQAALLADSGDCVLEREAARDLALEEEADHLALVGGLYLLAGNPDEVALTRPLN